MLAKPPPLWYQTGVVEDLKNATCDGAVKLERGLAAGATSYVVLGEVVGYEGNAQVTRLAVKCMQLQTPGMSCNFLSSVYRYNRFPSVEYRVTVAEFEEEVNCLKVCKSEFIVDFLGSRRFNKCDAWLCLEYCLKPCDEYLETARTRVERTNLTLHLYAPILNALEVIHRKGFVHRDIKPQNILFSPSGFPKLCDFGLCTEIGSDRYERALVPNNVAGTPYFCAPEIVLLERFDQKSDIFSLAVCIICAYSEFTPAEVFKVASWTDLISLYQKTYVKDETRYNELFDEACKDPLFIDERAEDWAIASSTVRSMVAIRPDERPTLDEIFENEIFTHLRKDWAAFTENKPAKATQQFKKLQAILADECLGWAKPSFTAFCEGYRPKV